MINKSDEHLDLEKRLEGIKEDLEVLASTFRNSKAVHSGDDDKTIYMALSVVVNDTHDLYDKHFPVEWEEGTIE